MEPVLPPRAPAAPGAPPAPAAPGAPPAPAAPGAPRAPGAPAAPGGQQRPAAAPAAPAVGTVVNGYRFKGGDPANEANWERL